MISDDCFVEENEGKSKSVFRKFVFALGLMGLFGCPKMWNEKNRIYQTLIRQGI